MKKIIISGKPSIKTDLDMAYQSAYFSVGDFDGDTLCKINAIECSNQDTYTYHHVSLNNKIAIKKIKIKAKKVKTNFRIYFLCNIIDSLNISVKHRYYLLNAGKYRVFNKYINMLCKQDHTIRSIFKNEPKVMGGFIWKRFKN